MYMHVVVVNVYYDLQTTSHQECTISRDHATMRRVIANGQNFYTSLEHPQNASLKL